MSKKSELAAMRYLNKVKPDEYKFKVIRSTNYINYSLSFNAECGNIVHFVVYKLTETKEESK